MNTIFSYIEAHKMIRPGQKILAAVSGGADSVCLLLVLKAYQKQVPFSLGVLHVEHGLRGEDSVADMEFVQRLCERWQLPCTVHRADVAGLAAREGLSLEEAGRRARYDWFGAELERQQADAVAVAHHINDQAETILWNLARGSGISGLGGMSPVRGRIIRPLLSTTRERVEELLKEYGQDYRTDGTNLETAYTRNRIRLELLPWMEERLNRRAAEHIAEAGEKLRRADAYIQRQADQAFAQIGTEKEGRTELLRKPFLELEDIIQEYVLRSCIERTGEGLKDVGAVHIEKLQALAAMDCGRRISLPGGLCAWREEERLCLGRPPSGPENVCIPVDRIPGRYEAAGLAVSIDFISPNLEKLPEKKYTKWLAYDTIQNGIALRTRQQGDYLIINRNGGKKLLKNYFIDQKIPRERRDKLLLLADGPHILWVIGYRISEGAKITGQTTKAIQIQVQQLQR